MTFYFKCYEQNNLIILWFKFVSWFESNLRDIFAFKLLLQKSRRLCTSSKQKGKVHSAGPIRKEEGGEKPAVRATAAETSRLEKSYGEVDVCNRHVQKVDFAFAKSHS